MSKTLKTSASDRKCGFLNCTNILSIYNHETYCHIHRDKALQTGKTRISISSIESNDDKSVPSDDKVENDKY